MNCINHPETPAIAFCRTCGKALCAICQRTAQGTVYCAEHLPSTAVPGGIPVPPPPPVAPTPESPYSAPSAPRPVAAVPITGPQASWTAPAAPSPYTTPFGSGDPSASPGLAFILGLIPGVGAIYNGQYVKGLIHVIILGILISIETSDASAGLGPLFGMLIAVWWFYMAFEAYHTARKRQIGQPVDEFSSIVPLHSSRRGFPVGPVLLIGFGVLFLLNTMDVLRFERLVRYWPVLLIVLGAYMLYERISGVITPPPGQEVSHEPR